MLIAIAISSLARPVWWAGGHGLFAVLLIIGGLYLLSPGFSGARGAPGAASAPLRTEGGGGAMPATEEFTAEYTAATPLPLLDPGAVVGWAR